MRDRLLDAAAELIAERGYARTTVQAIADRAGCAAGSVYNHFADKDDLLLGLLERWGAVEGAKVGLGDAAGADSRRFIEAWVLQRTDALAANEGLLRGLLAEMLVRPELRRRYRESVLGPRLEAGAAYLRHVGDRGPVRVDDPDLTARALLAAVLGAGLLRLLDDEPTRERWDEVRHTLVRVLLDGLAAGH